MNEEPLSVVDEDDADYSSPATLEATSQRRGISHQRDEDCITQKCKVSRLQATASDWHRHLDYGLHPGFPNLLMSETRTPACIVWRDFIFKEKKIKYRRFLFHSMSSMSSHRHVKQHFNVKGAACRILQHRAACLQSSTYLTPLYTPCLLH